MLAPLHSASSVSLALDLAPKISVLTFVRSDPYTNHAISAVLLQHASSEGSLLLPVAFYSKKLNSAEQKFPVHNHEMLAII